LKTDLKYIKGLIYLEQDKAE